MYSRMSEWLCRSSTASPASLLSVPFSFFSLVSLGLTLPPLRAGLQQGARVACPSPREVRNHQDQILREAVSERPIVMEKTKDQCLDVVYSLKLLPELPWRCYSEGYLGRYHQDNAAFSFFGKTFVIKTNQCLSVTFHLFLSVTLARLSQGGVVLLH